MQKIKRLYVSNSRMRIKVNQERVLLLLRMQKAAKKVNLNLTSRKF